MLLKALLPTRHRITITNPHYHKAKRVYKPWLQQVIWSAIESPKSVLQFPSLDVAGFACKQNAAGMNIVLMNNALTPAALLQQLTVVQEDQLHC
jgi:hypothetical protein